MGTKSAEKQVKVSEKREAHNKAVKSLAKTRVTRAQKAITSGELDKAKNSVLAAISSLDRATSGGVLHPNSAARRKSRLMKKLNRAQAAPEAGKTQKAEKEKS